MLALFPHKVQMVTDVEAVKAEPTAVYLHLCLKLCIHTDYMFTWNI